MSEEETRAKGQRPRIAKLSVMSVILSIAGLLLGSIGAPVSEHFYYTTNWGWLNRRNIYFVALSISILSLIICKIGLKNIQKSNGLISGERIVRHGRLISVIAIIWACIGLWISLTGIGPHD